MGSRLAVEVDGVKLGDDEAREVWARFSAFMDDQGDMQAFAKSEGVARVTTAIRSGVPTLIVTSRED
jgi:hypothetical protein